MVNNKITKSSNNMDAETVASFGDEWSRYDQSNMSFSEASEISEVFHYSNDGKCSWYDFAREIVQISGKKCSIDPIFSKDYPQSATRPKHVLLDKDKIRILEEIDGWYWSKLDKDFYEALEILKMSQVSGEFHKNKLREC